MAERFEGFPAGALPWLRRLKKNNDRAWFAERKGEYESLLVEPMLLLVQELGAALAEAGLPLAPSAKSPVFRIYRDIRFSGDKSPFKTHIASVLHRDGNKRLDGIGYLHIDPEGSFAAAGFWQPEKAALNLWRERIAEQPGPLLRMHKKLPLDPEDTLARMPRGYEQHGDAPHAHLLRLKSFVVREPLAAEALASREVLDRAAAFARKALPLLEYGWRFDRPTPARID